MPLIDLFPTEGGFYEDEMSEYMRQFQWAEGYAC